MTSRTLDQLNERIGEAGALRLIRHFGGRRLYVPLRIADRHPIRLSLGNVIADKLEIEYGGLWIDPVPRDDVALRDDRDDEILRQIKAGDSAQEVARRFGLSPRSIQRIVKSKLDERREATA